MHFISYCLLWKLFSHIFQGSGPHLGEMLCYQCMCNDRARATLARPGWSSADKEHSTGCLCQGERGMGWPGSTEGVTCTVFVCGLNYSHGLFWARSWCPQLYLWIKFVFFIFKYQERTCIIEKNKLIMKTHGVNKAVQGIKPHLDM